MKQGKKYISPGAWFSMVYPADWNEFEDGEGSFLFYNPNEWTGNFRISAYKGSATYGKEAVEQELKENTSATPVKDRACVDVRTVRRCSRKKGCTTLLISGLAGMDDVAFECSFTVRKGEPVTEAENHNSLTGSTQSQSEISGRRSSRYACLKFIR